MRIRLRPIRPSWYAPKNFSGNRLSTSTFKSSPADADSARTFASRDADFKNLSRFICGLTGLRLNYLGIRLDSTKADGLKFVINLITPDNGEKFVVELSNATLTNIKGQQSTNPNLTVTVNRSDLESVMGGTATFDDLIKAGKATFVGDRKPFDQLRGLLVRFTPDFELLPGTKPTKAVSPVPKDPFAVSETGDTGGG